MKQPWVVTPDGVVAYDAPERWLFEAGAWGQVEAYLGTRLPSDYKDLVADGPAWIFDDELVIASPFDPDPHCNLIRLAAGSAWALASLRHADPDAYPVAIYPEPAGVLAWGVDGGGGNYHWDTSHPDPDCWTICIEGRPLGSQLECHAWPISAYLDALRTGRVSAAALQGWPGPDPTLVRRVLT